MFLQHKVRICGFLDKLCLGYRKRQCRILLPNYICSPLLTQPHHIGRVSRHLTGRAIQRSEARGGPSNPQRGWAYETGKHVLWRQLRSPGCHKGKSNNRRLKCPISQRAILPTSIDKTNNSQPYGHSTSMLVLTPSALFHTSIAMDVAGTQLL